MKMLTWILALFYFFNTNDIIAQDFFNKTDDFFNTYVTDKGVNYSSLKENDAALDFLIFDIEHMALNGRSKEFKLAFYINAYNLLVIKSIVDNMPVNSPLDIDGFFKSKEHIVSIESITLDDLENVKIRATFKDPRIHFALVCAGLGCPPLTEVAFSPENVNERLNILTKKALNDPNFIQVDKLNEEVKISKIFDWFSNDFGDNGVEVLSYINKYRNQPIPMSYKKLYYEYDWKLNGY